MPKSYDGTILDSNILALHNTEQLNTTISGTNTLAHLLANNVESFSPPESTLASPENANPPNTDSIHNALSIMGFTPLVGNFADAADAILYGLEGEYGDAVISSLAAIPMVGQYVSAQKLLKKAKDSGEEIVKVFRGYPQWFKGSMVKDGRFVSGAKRVAPDFSPKENMLVKDIFFTAKTKKIAEGYASNPMLKSNLQKPMTGSRAARKMEFELTNESKVLEFHIPKSVFDKTAIGRFGNKSLKEIDDYQVAVFEGGLPKDFLVKVHSYTNKPFRAYNPWSSAGKYADDAIQ